MNPRLRLVQPFDTTAPTYPRHNGHAVSWQPWRPPMPLSRVVLACDVCGTSGQVWSAAGRIRRSRPAWPVSELVAFRCGVCRGTSVFDMGRSGGNWIEIDTDTHRPGRHP